MFEVLDVVLEVYHTQHIFKYTMHVLLEVVDVVFTLHNARSKYVVCKSLSTIVMLVVHTHKGI